ncbi:hypothetical protein EYF80_042564 [Liparis tanakae]|uniref:Uncharacterized protein n=1 Tax=Liparis tanakae TaxID=230148 RepID=A0A4Z2G0Y9_9TELE|nr:hypothetical protein EYF80_042564 [Liparis tanakae]
MEPRGAVGDLLTADFTSSKHSALCEGHWEGASDSSHTESITTRQRDWSNKAKQTITEDSRTHSSLSSAHLNTWDEY